MLSVQHQAAIVLGWELAPRAGRPAGLPALSGQDETLGSKGSQVKSARSRTAPQDHGGASLPADLACDLR